MDLSSISSAASQSAGDSSAYAVKVMRKALDIEATQGAMLAQMVSQNAGLGRSVDMTA